ncbi:EthD domain-containing protein [Streptomyces europaeiscabiei]|uniref:EthD domain-containing protein n=1 Tax=Streptomyces europaeiscabiei TaxID=146819 RepID=A0ABU4NIR8_9ACTN|nr:EthD domain-containing protein [Streptomyces europaeiscabiei]MDX2524302.1 EthD domain-containing protein [Streptomyces europaeiscabiei]MDX2757597.1 EthD domain-containing protein [Streptomyces europaeiscabiei]MDX2767132.1 EthD domain-containing protein [Streptomyces europaeiscabiei]MDX3545566.1 EthD domain-containing protein [Streptomyces europaeiscabiei]MDX3555037.1 EthD domain-containing protein [Streptomyces europaeiscabiei]
MLGQEAPHAKALHGCVQHRQVPGAEQLLSHFGGRDQHVYEGVAALYCDSADDALAHFPAYEWSLREHSAKAGGFHDPSRSFVLYSREVTVLAR